MRLVARDTPFASFFAGSFVPADFFYGLFLGACFGGDFLGAGFAGVFLAAALGVGFLGAGFFFAGYVHDSTSENSIEAVDYLSFARIASSAEEG